MDDLNELEWLAKEIHSLCGHHATFTQRTNIGASGFLDTGYFAVIRDTSVNFEGMTIPQLRAACIAHVERYSNRREQEIEALKAKAKELGIKPEELL